MFIVTVSAIHCWLYSSSNHNSPCRHLHTAPLPAPPNVYSVTQSRDHWKWQRCVSTHTHTQFHAHARVRDCVKRHVLSSPSLLSVSDSDFFAVINISSESWVSRSLSWLMSRACCSAVWRDETTDSSWSSWRRRNVSPHWMSIGRDLSEIISHGCLHAIRQNELETNPESCNRS